MVLLIINGTIQLNKTLNKRKKHLNNQRTINFMIKANNMIEVTSAIQKQNGTVAFFCSNTFSIYTSHTNGYVRRKTFDYKTGKTAQYQLNRVDGATGKRIMIDDPIDRMVMIINAMKNYNRTFDKRLWADLVPSK